MLELRAGRTQERAKPPRGDALLVQLLGIRAGPDAGLTLGDLASMVTHDGLQLVVLAPLQTCQGVKCLHRVIVVLH